MAEDYEELKPKDFSENIEKYEKGIEKEPENPMNYYFLGKEYMLCVPIRAISNFNYLGNLFKKSLELGPELWAPKIFLGELLFKQGKFEEAEGYFKNALKEKPESVSVREYLAECMEKDSEKKRNEKELLYLFENDLRKFIKKVLIEEFGDNWWRGGVPTKVRASCMARREEGLEEEKDLDPILFANFFDYKNIISKNKSIFGQYFNVKEWCKKLDELEPIRNVVAHNRDLDRAFEKINEFYGDLREVL